MTKSMDQNKMMMKMTTKMMMIQSLRASQTLMRALNDTTALGTHKIFVVP